MLFCLYFMGRKLENFFLVKLNFFLVKNIEKLGFLGIKISLFYGEFE